MKPLLAIATTLLLGMSSGCVVLEDDGRFDPGDTPGQAPWNHDENVACTTADECGAGEACENGVCQMARCDASFESLAPMGKNHYFGTDAELTVISDDFFIDGIESTDGTYLSSWDLQAQDGKVVDVAAGDLTGSSPHTIAVAIEFSDAVLLSGPDGESQINVGLWPLAIAVGDVDGDGLDELVAFSEAGEIAVCNVELDSCRAASIEGAAGKDVAVADVDGDGFEEALFLFDNEGESELVVWNVDAADTGQDESYGWRFNFPVRAIAAGKLGGAPSAEVAMLEDGGWWGWSDDKVHVFSPATEAFVGVKNVDGHTLDLAIGDRDSNDREELAILRDAQKIELLTLSSQGALTTAATWDIPVGQAATRISFVDWNGDSATGTLIEGPELIAGDAVPIAALMFPPYGHDVSPGGTSSVTLGSNESSDESFSDTLSLSVGIGLSFGAEAFGFKAKVGGYLKQSVSVGHSVSRSVSVGARYKVAADPELHGTGYAPVVMSCGCYHRYKYKTHDPNNLLGGSGQTVDIYVPVGGQTQLWSSKRYNALAEATGLPIIQVPMRVGDVDSYATELLNLDGGPVDPGDLVFPSLPQFQASDVGYVDFWLTAGESETNDIATSTTLGVNASFGAGGVSVDTNVDVGVTQGYSISVGKSQIFAGGIPPIVDNPKTPEDEFALHRYGFMPGVFRQHYVDRHGAPAAYYVLNYAVAK